MMQRIAYSSEVKWKCVKMKAEGFSTREIMDELNIRNRTQVNTWWRWYKNNETHRFDQNVGKQYSYGKGTEELSEIEQLKLDNKRKAAEIDVPKKVQGVGKELGPEIVVSLVESLKNEHPLSLILSTLEVARSTYYRWKKQSDRAKDEITIKIGELCKKYNYTYGYRKICYLLNKQTKQRVNHKRVQRIMQKNKWNCRVRVKKKTRIGRPYHLTDNLLKGDFKSDQPLTKLVTDITYLPFGNTMLYLSSIMDLHNGEIVAFTIGDVQDTNFVLDTLNQLNIPKGCMLHSDQGSVYTSREYYLACKEKGIIRSMSRKGTPSDNACIECFHSTLKSETFYLNSEQKNSNFIVKEIVSNYIKNYNENRIQQKLGYLSPVQYRIQATL
ncbi:IS3 family transposase [Macrococcus brunensis]|uniref:IS3 family transposase n=1 Tax=Macrococcus brunensis TaxID=198483 RepID=UPI001EF0770B|nr:IS3 family transposase [Macrococcus brunensis]ULG73052.1 IS3 family transposase [Macrococcus brunensis]ULG73058.1 IS3 family transposase [Macrococcus brunensis]ULG73060.1 IS3 family transposase [Macrococcus brunensis]ULG73088.1 IS3 family transposase [Macrococcus brunensis]ULG73091.1 IS3 family transposase [Macrococcus brunensis]